MAEPGIDALFTHWRRGDADAGRAMAQRFTDWFFAIGVSRHGEAVGEPRFQAVCAAFGEGVTRVPDSRRLRAWARQLVAEHLVGDDGRHRGEDAPGRFTRKKGPKILLLEARDGVADAMARLEPVYRGAPLPDELDALLEARYVLKRWLARTHRLPFKGLGDGDLDPDLGPMVLYEAGRLDARGDAAFEDHLLAAPALCRDVAEFAQLALALRDGLPGEPPRRAAPPAPPPPAPPPPASLRSAAASSTPPTLRPAAPVEDPGPPPPAGLPWPAIVGVVGLIALAAAAYFLGGLGG